MYGEIISSLAKRGFIIFVEIEKKLKTEYLVGFLTKIKKFQLISF
jgi:hypothetical protein